MGKRNDTKIVKPRRVWIAVLLGLFVGSVAQIYVGRLRRGVLFWIGEILLDIFSRFALISFRLEGVWEIVGLPFLCLVLYRVLVAIDAGLIARRDQQVPPKRYQRWWWYLVFVVAFYATKVGIIYVSTIFVAKAFAVADQTMAPTIQVGDRILVDKFWASPDQLKRYDVVVFRYAPTGNPFVMRVIGLPGETIEIRDERVLIDGQPIEDPHAMIDGPPIDSMRVTMLRKSCPEYEKLLNYGPEKIPPDHFFVLGDNRRISRDSRFFGPVSFSDYIGTACMICWSRKCVYINPDDSSQHKLGPTWWDRIGTRLD